MRKMFVTNEVFGDCSDLSSEDSCLIWGDAHFVMVKHLSDGRPPMFLEFSYGQIWAPDLNPVDVKSVASTEEHPRLAILPGAGLMAYGRLMKLHSSKLSLLPGFHFQIQLKRKIAPVYLVHYEGVEQLSMPWGSRWIFADSRANQDSAEVQFMETASQYMQNN